MKRIFSVLLAICTVLTTLCIPPAPVTAQSTETAETPVSEQIDQTVTLPVEEEPITLEALAEDCKILQYVDEEAFAAADHAFRLPYLEELDTYVFQNEDGTRSIYYLYENVKYIDEQGNIREKDNTLQRETKGFRITENEFDLLLPHAVTDGVELTYQGYDVKLIPATEGKLTATAPGTLQDNSVVYESFFGAGTSLVYTPLLSGVKEEIILEEYLPNKSFSFLLYTDGLYVTEFEGRYILTQTKTSADAVLYLGDIVVYDAIGRPSLGNLTVETVKAGDVYTLTVSADEEFLSDPATVYPVTIDPDITISDTDNGSGAIEDTTIFSGTPNLNAGDWVRNTAGYVDETYGAGRILVRLPGLYNDEIYQGLTADRILSATFYTTKSSSKTPDYVNLYRCTSIAWGETEATWNNSANLYATDANWGTASTSSSTVSFNITTLVKYWKNRYLIPATGFMLVNQNETNTNKKFGIYASEYSATEKRPYFVLEYEADIVLDKSELEVKLGTSGTLNATTSPANQQVSWRSSNEAVASVTPSGVVTPHHAGTTTITAWFTDSDGVDHEAQCTVYVALDDGVYCFGNEYASYRVGLVSPAAYQAGAALYETPGISSLPTERHQFFKVTYLGAGLYSIRSMLDVTLGWEHGGYNPTCVEIGTSKTTVPLDAQWYISYDSGGDCYSIYGNTGLGGGDMSRTLTCTGNVELIPHPGLQGYSSSNAMQDWQITKLTYSGSGIELRRKTSYLAVGDSFTFTATVYSSHPDEFGQGEITWSVANGTGNASISQNGEAVGTSQGTVIIKAEYEFASEIDTDDYSLYIIPLKEGTYYIRNKETGYHTDIEEQVMAVNTEIHQWGFHRGATQKWLLRYVSNGYYTIHSSYNTNYMMGVKDNSQETDAAIVLKTGAIDAGVLWRFESTPQGAYRIIPKLAETAEGSRSLVATTSVPTNGDRIAYGFFVENNSYRDEWYLCKERTSVSLEGQQQTKWCWVASARMIASRYMDVPYSQTQGALWSMLDLFTFNPTLEQIDRANERGSIEHAEAAVEFFVGGRVCYGVEEKIYSEEGLRTLLNQSIPVLVMRINYQNGVPNGGHDIVIVDYIYDTSVADYRYIVYDPLPVGEGSVYRMTYAAICNDANEEDPSKRLGYIWKNTATFEFEDYENTVDWPGVE